MIGNKTNHHDQGEKEALQLSSEVLLRAAFFLVLPVQNAQDVGLECCQQQCHNDDQRAQSVVDHLEVFHVSSKFEAGGVGVR